MKTKLIYPMRVRSYAFFFYRIARIVLGFALTISVALARPRDALPPMPELTPILFHESFDYVCQNCATHSQATILNYGELIQSWSWFALQRSGTVTPFIIPGVDSAGRTNVACGTGAIRLWVKPYWTSASLTNGTGPGAYATLLALAVGANKQAAAVWSLQVSPDGSALSLIGQSKAGPAELLKADIGWQAGEWHLITLDYGKATALFIDGHLVVEGAGTLAVSPQAAALVIGSTFAGTDTIVGEIEEIYSFGLPLTAEDVAFYYHGLSHQAALGPITAAEDQAWEEMLAKWQAEQEALPEGGSPQMRLLGSTSECLTNEPVYLTNIVSTLDTNQGWTIMFDIQGGTNGLLYDVFTTTNLSGDNGTNAQWTWLEQGPTCNTYQYTNQPDAEAFYILGTPLDTDHDGLTDAYENLVSKTDPHNPDTDGDGVSDGDEVLIYHTDPNNQDSNGDGVIDQRFTVVITQPNSGSSLP